MNAPIASARTIWPAWWYLVVLLSAFIYLLPVWVDSIVPSAVYDLSYTVDSPARLGQFASAHIVRCSRTQDPQVYYFVRTFLSLDDSSDIITTAGNGIATTGCHKVLALVGPIPLDAEPGKYRLISVLINQGVFRPTTLSYVSNEFEVIR